MIQFLDTSAFVKRYVVEDGSESVMTLFRRRSEPAIARICEIEAAGAIARRAREGSLTPRQRDQLLRRVAADCRECRVTELTLAIVQLSVALLRKHALRSMDAIHLASAIWLRDQVGGSLRFVCADGPLVAAAHAEDVATFIPGA